MRPYVSTLPESFPYCIRVPDDLILEIFTALAYPRQAAHNGSSFAITADAPQGHKNVWLSIVSYNTLRNNHIIPEVQRIGSGE